MVESFETLPFYRGLSSKILVSDPFIKKVRHDRKPRNMPLSLHLEADTWFKSRYGVSYRSQAVFLTGSKFIAQNYASDPSNVVRVIPIGHYSYCWSPIRTDLLFYCSEQSSLSVETYLNESDYRQTGLMEASNCGNEVMLFCEKYIAIPLGLLGAGHSLGDQKAILLP